MIRHLWRSDGGTLLDPLVCRSGLSPRGYSKVLQRAFVSFGLANARTSSWSTTGWTSLKARYAIWSTSTVAGSARARFRRFAFCPNPEPGRSIIVTVEHPADREGKDLRKAKRIEWREYKLCAAREQGCAKSFYGGGFDKPEDAGIKAAYRASKARWSSGTYIHDVADGAQWIKKQFDCQFSARGRYLLDFFHLSEYLAEAGKAAGKEASESPVSMDSGERRKHRSRENP